MRNEFLGMSLWVYFVAYLAMAWAGISSYLIHRRSEIETGSITFRWFIFGLFLEAVLAGFSGSVGLFTALVLGYAAETVIMCAALAAFFNRSVYAMVLDSETLDWCKKLLKAAVRGVVQRVFGIDLKLGD